MKLLKRLLLAASINSFYAVTLGLLFACAAAGFSPGALGLPGVIPVALIASTIAAALVTPSAMWTVRTGTRNLLIYGPILWITLAAYVAFVIPKIGGASGEMGLLAISVVGLVAIGFVPPRTDTEPSSDTGGATRQPPC
jgi:hypothetical protein